MDVKGITRTCPLDEIGELVGTTLKIIDIEDAFSQPAKKSGHSVFKHLATWAQKSGPGQQRSAEVEQIVLVASGSVEQQKCRRGFGTFAGDEAVHE
jgi:hypothetical protein